MKANIKEWSIYSLGDHAIVFALASKMDVFILEKIKGLNEFIAAKNITGIIDIIPSYHTLTIIYDISLFIAEPENASNELLLFSKQLLNEFENSFSGNNKTNSKVYRIPVCYENIFGIDLENISTTNQISAQEIIRLHTATIYDVYSIGFLPGFTYMGIVNDKIKIARHSKPRLMVPAGSIGIAGLQTGIYPSNSPGGWQIIGKTPIKIFDPNPEYLAKFKVGDKVQFYAINMKEYEQLNEYK